MAKQSFPKSLYVVREPDGDGSYLVAHEDVSNAVEIGAVQRIAVYKLDKMVDASTSVIMVDVK